MPEQTDAGEEHSHAVLVGGLDDLGIPNRTAWMNYRGDANFVSGVDAITEWEERV